MKESTQLIQGKVKSLQQVIGINRVKGPSIHTKYTIQKALMKYEVLMMLESTRIELVCAKAKS